MKSVFKREICTTCLKQSEAFICRGCRQPFCAKHVGQHREKIAKEMNRIVGQCHRFGEEAKSEKFAQPIYNKIDQWERQSIEKIRQIAQAARSDVKPWLERVRIELEEPFQKLLHEVEAKKQAQDYTEVDFKRWGAQLKSLKDRLEQRPIIDHADDDDPNSIHLIRITEHVSNGHGSNDTMASDQLSDRSLDNFQGHSTFDRERFGDTFGAIELSDDDRVATYAGPWMGDASVTGRNTYANGVHHLHFRVVEKFYTAPFFGIVTASQPSVERMIKSPSTNGWINFDYQVINGEQETVGRSRIIHPGDAVTLTLDCERRQIFFRHSRTDRLLQLPIDTRVCPFPWKILIVLQRRGDCVRLRGGSLGLTTQDLVTRLISNRTAT